MSRGGVIEIVKSSWDMFFRIEDWGGKPFYRRDDFYHPARINDYFHRLMFFIFPLISNYRLIIRKQGQLWLGYLCRLKNWEIVSPRVKFFESVPQLALPLNRYPSNFLNLGYAGYRVTRKLIMLAQHCWVSAGTGNHENL